MISFDRINIGHIIAQGRWGSGAKGRCACRRDGLAGLRGSRLARVSRTYQVSILIDWIEYNTNFREAVQIQGLDIWKSAKERLKELSFPAMKLSALIAIEGKKIIVATPLSTPTLATSMWSWFTTLFITLMFIFLDSWDYSCLILKSNLNIDQFNFALRQLCCLAGPKSMHAIDCPANPRHWVITPHMGRGLCFRLCTCLHIGGWRDTFQNRTSSPIITIHTAWSCKWSSG